MLESARQRILERLGEDDLVLDIGGWADPFQRADWVLDINPYETRGLYEQAGWKQGGDSAPERFTQETWVQRDICDRERFPFADAQFDFVLCTHTLEDVRDPVWVCSEISRVGKAGYIEVPSRLEEQSWGVTGPLAGHPHHHWLTEANETGLEFVFKPHNIHSELDWQFPKEFFKQLSPEERNLGFWWEGSLTAEERVLFFEINEYLAGFVARELEARDMEGRREHLLRRVGRRLLRGR